MDVAGDVEASTVNVPPVDQPCEVCGLLVTAEYIARTGAARHGNHPPRTATATAGTDAPADQDPELEREVDDQVDEDVDDGTGPGDVLQAVDGALLTVAQLQDYLDQMPATAPVLLAPAGGRGASGRTPLGVAWPVLHTTSDAPLWAQDPADVQFAVVLAPA